MPPEDHRSSSQASAAAVTGPLVPSYLQETYWWAYIHPRAVRIFERGWLVNLILLGNYRRLRNAALAEVGPDADGHTLQIACVYGDFTARLAERIGPDGTLDVVDVMPIQLHNLKAKLPPDTRARLLHRVAELIKEQAETLAHAESVDSGKPLSAARQVDIPRAAANFEFFSSAIQQFANPCDIAGFSGFDQFRVRSRLRPQR